MPKTPGNATIRVSDAVMQVIEDLSNELHLTKGGVVKELAQVYALHLAKDAGATLDRIAETSIPQDEQRGWSALTQAMLVSGILGLVHLLRRERAPGEVQS